MTQCNDYNELFLYAQKAFMHVSDSKWGDSRRSSFAQNDIDFLHEQFLKILKILQEHALPQKIIIGMGVSLLNRIENIKPDSHEARDLMHEQSWTWYTNEMRACVTNYQKNYLPFQEKLQLETAMQPAVPNTDDKPIFKL